RLPLYQLLSLQPGLSLQVAFNAASETNRKWRLPGSFDFPHTVLPGKTLSLRRDDLLAYHVNWGVGSWLRHHSFDAVIVGGWSSLAQQTAIVSCHRSGIPAILWAGSTHGEPSGIRQLSLPVVRRLVGRADRYISYGNGAKRYLESLGADSSSITLALNT